MDVPTSTLRQQRVHPLPPAVIFRAVVTADDSMYESFVATDDPSPLHTSGSWRLARFATWSAEAEAPARALLTLLRGVDHPLASAAIEALVEGLALVRDRVDETTTTMSDETFADTEDSAA